MTAVATYPDSTKTSLEQRLRARARDRWPQIASLQVRHRGNFSYVDATLTGATTSSCAGCAMSAPPASGSSPSTAPATTTTTNRSSSPACPSAPAKTPSTPPAASTSTTPPPGPDPRRTYGPDH